VKICDNRQSEALCFPEKTNIRDNATLVGLNVSELGEATPTREMSWSPEPNRN
jgi:hypothetical protein